MQHKQSHFKDLYNAEKNHNFDRQYYIEAVYIE
jgi:hypothetical protein